MTTIIAGLGNPVTKYQNTPHNIGFETIDEFARENNFPDFVLSKKFKALISEKDSIILAKPQTFMNNSGLCVKKLLEVRPPQSCGGRTSADFVVIHDDIDLLLGKIKISQNRGSAGHKGVESIIKELGTKNFKRIRIGVCPEKKPANIEKYVLTKFKKQDKDIIKKSIRETIKTIYELSNSRKSD